MADEMKQAWDDVAQRFGSLGRALREQYTADDGKDEGDADAVKEALDRLREAARDLAERTGHVVHDEGIRAHTKEVAVALEKALTSTAEEIGQSLEGLVRRTKGD